MLFFNKGPDYVGRLDQLRDKDARRIAKEFDVNPSKILPYTLFFERMVSQVGLYTSGESISADNIRKYHILIPELLAHSATHYYELSNRRIIHYPFSVPTNILFTDPSIILQMFLEGTLISCVQSPESCYDRAVAFEKILGSYSFSDDAVEDITILI